MDSRRCWPSASWLTVDSRALLAFGELVYSADKLFHTGSEFLHVASEQE